MSDMTKQCITCKKHLPMDEFYVSKNAKDGKQSKCIACIADYNREYRIRKLSSFKPKKGYELKLTNVRKSDYHKMFQLIKQFGYDVHKNIHEQFCAKYGLPQKKRIKKMENMYNASDFSDL